MLPNSVQNTSGKYLASLVHRKRHEADRFFLFLSFNAVHTPMHATDERIQKFAHIAVPVRRIYNAMNLAMDEMVGTVMDPRVQLRGKNNRDFPQ